MAGFLLVNPRSGSASPSANELVEAARARGIDAHVLQPDEDAAESARGADAQALGIAGGDGSLAAVAAVAVERDLRFVCIPFGTRNHFARDIGLARNDPLAALDAYRGHERRIDVGFANERLFLNNVSLGVYARLVHRREHHRRRRQALAHIRASFALLKQREPLGISVDGVAVDARLVLVGNNAYVLELPTIGARKRLDEGIIALYVVQGGVDERRGQRFLVDTRAGRIDAAVDGEPDVLATPIEFRVQRRALRLLVPPGL